MTIRERVTWWAYHLWHSPGMRTGNLSWDRRAARDALDDIRYIVKWREWRRLRPALRRLLKWSRNLVVSHAWFVLVVLHIGCAGWRWRNTGIRPLRRLNQHICDWLDSERMIAEDSEPMSKTNRNVLCGALAFAFVLSLAHLARCVQP